MEKTGRRSSYESLQGDAMGLGEGIEKGENGDRRVVEVGISGGGKSLREYGCFMAGCCYCSGVFVGMVVGAVLTLVFMVLVYKNPQGNECGGRSFPTVG